MMVENRTRKKKEKIQLLWQWILFEHRNVSPPSPRILVRMRGGSLNPDLFGLFYPWNDREQRRHATVTQSRGIESGWGRSDALPRALSSTVRFRAWNTLWNTF